MSTIYFVSLGCPKNLIDSEVMLGLLGTEGHAVSADPAFADVLIVNTCAFIRDAREEAEAEIQRLASTKGKGQNLIVCGCLPQLQARRLFHRHPEIDALLGTHHVPSIGEVVSRLEKGEKRLFYLDPPTFIHDATHPRLVTTPPSYAYLKIAEGCSNWCSYCQVPRLRGPYRSREPDDVIAEATGLVSMGVSELVLVAQDTTLYGQDLAQPADLASLVRLLDQELSGVWIRILYAHPAHWTDELTRTMAACPTVVPYVDLPLQHTHDEILQAMGRPPSSVAEGIIEKIRSIMHAVALRTSLLVGFPGETEEHYQKLLRDVERLEFDWVGVFAYSPERSTKAWDMKGKVPASIRRRRRDHLMLLQQEITLRHNERRVGRDFDILVDTLEEGHAAFQAPEIDGVVVTDGEHAPGARLHVTATQVLDIYDLKATPSPESSYSR